MAYKHLLPKILFVFLIMASSQFSYAQQLTKQEKLKKLFKPAAKSSYNQYLKNSTNELETTASLLFMGYKNFFSSQDMNSCVFTPSCSVYAIQSLQHDNPLKAYLKIFDRLSRCHPLPAKGEYSYYKNTNLQYDPAF